MPGITPSNTYTTRDGKHVTIGANGDAIFRRFMVAIGRPDLAGDPGLANNAGRDSRAAEIYGVISDWVAAHDEAVVLETAARAETPASRIYSVADMFEDPQFLARGMLQQALLPGGASFAIPGVVPKLSGTPGGTEWVGPALGEHTDEVLVQLGYSLDAVARLRGAGVI
jgi:formyl-CoA transferase